MTPIVFDESLHQLRMAIGDDLFNRESLEKYVPVHLQTAAVKRMLRTDTYGKHARNIDFPDEQNMWPGYDKAQYEYETLYTIRKIYVRSLKRKCWVLLSDDYQYRFPIYCKSFKAAIRTMLYIENYYRENDKHRISTQRTIKPVFTFEQRNRGVKCAY